MNAPLPTSDLVPLIVRHGSFALATAYERAASLQRKVGATADAELLRVVARELRTHGGRAFDGFPESDVPIAVDGIASALRLAEGRQWGPGDVLGLREIGRFRFGKEWQTPAYLASGRFEGMDLGSVFALLAMIATTVWGCGANWWCFAGPFRPERQAPNEAMATVADDIRRGALAIRSPDDLAPVAAAASILIDAGAPPTLLAAYALAGPRPPRDRLRRLCRDIDGTAVADPIYGLG